MDVLMRFMDMRPSFLASWPDGRVFENDNIPDHYYDILFSGGFSLNTDYDADLRERIGYYSERLSGDRLSMAEEYIRNLVGEE